jgi:hypothetical protein
VAVVSTFSLNGAKEESMLKQGGRWKSEWIISSDDALTGELKLQILPDVFHNSFEEVSCLIFILPSLA